MGGGAGEEVEMEAAVGTGAEMVGAVGAERGAVKVGATEVEREGKARGEERVERETGVGRQIREDEGVLGAGMEEAAVRGTGEGMGVETVGRGRAEKCTVTRAG